MILGLSLIFLAALSSAHARGAGRAFPIDSENYAIDSFQNFNPDIEWDPTNFLVDKSGSFATCDKIGRGFERLLDKTPEGQSIGVLMDYVEGAGRDAEAVNGYIKQIIDKWMRERSYFQEVQGADRFGCSVRPGCRDRYGNDVVTVACLFSPDRYQQDPGTPSGEPPTFKPTPRPTRPTPRPTRPWPTYRPTIPPEPLQDPNGQAFTEEQYKVAEQITGNRWDASHFLENLSGLEISCSMLEVDDWPFTKAQEISENDPYIEKIMGLKGQAPNLGSTQPAMEEILSGFKKIRSASKVGCSVIPDCRGRGDIGGGVMWVVVACVYQNPEYY